MENQNRRISLVIASACLLLGALLSGCSTGSGNSPALQGSSGTPSTPLMGNSGPTFQTGDQVVIHYSGIPSAMQDHVEQIKSDGTIQPPLLSGPIEAVGKTKGQLEDELHAAYVPSIYKQVTITVHAPTQYYTVSGEVRLSGLFAYRGNMTVLDGIAAAGFFTDFARKSKITVTRVDGTQINFDYPKAAKNPRDFDESLHPNDIIYVPRRKM